jgi:hypothetical protein
MGIIGKQKYTQEEVDKLYDYLKTYHEKGMPIDYEILIDGFKAVRRTNDPEMFYMFENFVNSDSRAIEVLFYTGSSNNNDKHIFTFGEEPKEQQGLSGIEIDNRIKEGIEQEKRNWEFDSLKKENKELKETILELEDEIDQLEEEKATLTQGQSPLKGLLGELGSSFVEGFIRRNPKIIAKLPGGEALSGLIEEDNREKEQAQAPPAGDTEVSFTPKQSTPVSETNTESQFTEEDRQAITFVTQLKDAFNKEEFEQLMEIIQIMAANKESIKEVNEYLKHQENA